MSLSVSQYMVQLLKVWGVKRIYGVVGSEIIPLVDEVYKESSLQFIAVRHESAAGFMASTEAKETGIIGVCMTTAGPGLTNLLNGIADAAQDHVPVLVISGQVATKYIGTHYKQYINQQQLISPLALSSELVTDPDVMTTLLPQALKIASLQKGVTHVSIPVDLQSHLIQSNQLTITPPTKLIFNWSLAEVNVDNTVQQLNTAKRPVILIGGGARKAILSIKQLAGKTGACLLTSLGAKGLIEANHPLYLGGVGDGGSAEAHEILQDADLLLLIGCTWFPTKYIPHSLPIIQIELHPSHIALQHNVMASHIGRAEDIIPKITKELPDHLNPDWRSRVESTHERYLKRLSQEKTIHPAQTPIHPIHLMGEIEKVCPKDAFIILDTGEHTILFNRYFTGEVTRVLFSGKWRSMGYALPAANAVQLIHPNQKVIAMIGDGSLLMNVGELATSILHDLPITVLVMNNQSLILEERKSWKMGYSPNGTDLVNPDFARLAQSFGWQGIQVKKEEEIGKILASALEQNSPVLLDVHLNHAMLTNIPQYDHI